ncbi:hypothetical protein ACJX0J_031115, partial [Zea mays]
MQTRILAFIVKQESMNLRGAINFTYGLFSQVAHFKRLRLRDCTGKLPYLEENLCAIMAVRVSAEIESGTLNLGRESLIVIEKMILSRKITSVAAKPLNLISFFISDNAIIHFIILVNIICCNIILEYRGKYIFFFAMSNNYIIKIMTTTFCNEIQVYHNKENMWHN